jgi:drug/metabolite transporter (DMT)-like permease
LTSQSAQPQQSYLKAAMWMAGWLTAMLMLLVAGRETTRELNVFQVLEFRSLVGILLLYPLIRMHGGFRAMATRRPWQQIGRNVVHYTAQYLWFLALTLIPIAQVVSIEFTMPIWTAILAALFLGERITLRKSLAIAFGIIGVLVIVRPGVGASNLGHLIMLVAAVGFGISVVMMKSLTRTDAAVVIIFWMLVIQSALGFVPALYVWRWPAPHVWGWLVVVAFCGTYSHYCMTKALRYADATIVVPMDFLRVPLSAAVGWLVYAERLDVYTMIGAAVILAGNLFNLPRRAAVRLKVESSASSAASAP